MKAVSIILWCYLIVASVIIMGALSITPMDFLEIILKIVKEVVK